MAYIIQQRRDTIENWNSINPVLADAEIGFISDIDDTTGKQKSSLYKIGDGRTDWKNLPLFGFGGNVYDNWSGSDLSTSVASRQAILSKFEEFAGAAATMLNENVERLINGDSDLEGLINKLSTTQLVQIIEEVENEFEGKTEEEKAEILANQIVSRAILITEFNKVWEEINKNNEADAEFVNATEEHLQTLQEFADEYGPVVDGLVETSAGHTELLDKHEKFIYGWDEETGTNEETGEPITTHHDSIDEKFTIVNNLIEEKSAELQSNITNIENKHQILSEDDFGKISNFDGYSEGTLFFAYKDSD